MTPQQLADRLAGFCTDRERRAAEHGGQAVLTVAEIRGLLSDVQPQPPGLWITEREAEWILGRWTPEDADLAAQALAVHAHAEHAAGHTDTATAAIRLASRITEASR